RDVVTKPGVPKHRELELGGGVAADGGWAAGGWWLAGGIVAEAAWRTPHSHPTQDSNQRVTYDCPGLAAAAADARNGRSRRRTGAVRGPCARVPPNGEAKGG